MHLNYTGNSLSLTHKRTYATLLCGRLMDPRVNRRFEWKKSHQPSWFTVSYSTSLVEIIRSNLIKLLDVFFPAIYFSCSILFDAVSTAIGVWRDELYHLNRNSHLKHKRKKKLSICWCRCVMFSQWMSDECAMIFRISSYRSLSRHPHRTIAPNRRIGEIQLPRFHCAIFKWFDSIYGDNPWLRYKSMRKYWKSISDQNTKNAHTAHSSHAQSNRTENSEIELSSTVFCVPFVCSQLFLFFFLLVFFFIFIFFCFSAVVEELCMSMNSNVNWLLINLFNCMSSSRSCNTHRHTHTNHLKSSNE